MRVPIAAHRARLSPARPHTSTRLTAGRLVGIAILAMALVAGCTTTLSGHGVTTSTSTTTGSASASPSASPNVPKIRLSDCAQLFNLSAGGNPAARLKHLSFDCGKVAVPLDYTDPTGATMDVQVLRMHDDRQTKSLGSLLVNPGGPGGSGLTLPIELAGSLSDTILQHFDVVGFDPRGVGLSNPVECATDAQKDSYYAMDPDIRIPAAFAQTKKDLGAIADACTRKYGPQLADFNTVYTAMDMDRIRDAMGDTQLNYLGFSYGTELGMVYAHLYPTKVRVAVLDGAVDPTTDYITSFADQLKGFEDAFDQFAADCLTRAACKALGNPRQVVQQLVAKANATPLKSTTAGETRLATGGIVLNGVLSALYDESFWPDLGDALIAAQKGDPDGLFELSDGYSQRSSNGTYSNIFDANTTISCNDSPVGPTDAQIQTTAGQWATAYPMFGLWGAASLFSCQNWQPTRHLLPSPAATGSNPILVVGTIHDPATPYAGAQHLATALTTGVLLTWNGQGHTAYLKSNCIDTKVDNYLVNKTVPPPNTICPA